MTWLGIVLAHLVGDYILQTHWMATQKTERWVPAIAHGMVYTLVQGFQNKSTGHPAEKPVALLRRVIELTGVREGQVILDPFTGSGTALIAARELNVRSIGIEAEERWCEVTAERLAQQPLVFDQAPQVEPWADEELLIPEEEPTNV